MKTLESLWFSDVFRGYGKGSLSGKRSIQYLFKTLDTNERDSLQIGNTTQTYLNHNIKAVNNLNISNITPSATPSKFTSIADLHGSMPYYKFTLE